MAVRKIILVFIGLALLLTIYLFGTRYQIVRMNDGSVIKFNRATGAAWFIPFRGEERRIEPEKTESEQVSKLHPVTDPDLLEQLNRSNPEERDPLNLLPRK